MQIIKQVHHVQITTLFYLCCDQNAFMLFGRSLACRQYGSQSTGYKFSIERTQQQSTFCLANENAHISRYCARLFRCPPLLTANMKDKRLSAALRLAQIADYCTNTIGALIPRLYHYFVVCNFIAFIDVPPDWFFDGSSS